ncbi:MAG: ribonuclease P protein component [Bdellovibrionales bacterium]|nr:ribonuclease P protein component [Bdellovibrionales bacterium]
MDFPKLVRVRRRYEYLRFFNQSEVKRFDSCVVFRIPNTEERARLGVTVKSKSGSVIRNKVKRIVREAFRLHRDRLKSFDYNVVVSGNQPISYITAKKVRKNLESIWSHEVLF